MFATPDTFPGQGTNLNNLLPPNSLMSGAIPNAKISETLGTAEVKRTLITNLMKKREKLDRTLQKKRQLKLAEKQRQK